MVQKYGEGVRTLWSSALGLWVESVGGIKAGIAVETGLRACVSGRRLEVSTALTILVPGSLAVSAIWSLTHEAPAPMKTQDSQNW